MHSRRAVVLTVCEIAVQRSGLADEWIGPAIFHSDHDSVYTSRAYTELCDGLGIIRSMGAVGSKADNALAESFNATLKREVLKDNTSWPDQATCRRELFRWLPRYNTRRRHSFCSYQTPNTYEATFAATVRTAAQSTPCPRSGDKARRSDEGRRSP